MKTVTKPVRSVRSKLRRPNHPKLVRQHPAQPATVPVTTVQMAERLLACSDDLLTLRLAVGVMDNNRVPLAEGRPTYYVDLDFDRAGVDDEWRYVDSQALAEGLARCLRTMQDRVHDSIRLLVDTVPEFAAAWEGGEK